MRKRTSSGRHLFDTSLNKDNIYRRDLIMSFVNKYVTPKNAVALEIGVGNGRFPKLLSPFFKSYYGIDPDSELLSIAKDNNPGVLFKKGVAERVPFVRKFDVILYTLSLHFSNVNKSLKELSRLLKKDGLVVIFEPTVGGKWRHPVLNKSSSSFSQSAFDDKIRALNDTLSLLKSQKDFSILFNEVDKKTSCRIVLLRKKSIGSADFRERVYAKLRKVPKGRVTTYKHLAEAVGTKAYRAVGTAMNKNPYAPQVPCHRVVSADGSIGGFASGTKNKIKILKSEGVSVLNDRVVDFERRLFRF